MKTHLTIANYLGWASCGRPNPYLRTDAIEEVSCRLCLATMIRVHDHQLARLEARLRVIEGRGAPRPARRAVRSPIRLAIAARETTSNETTPRNR